MKNCSARYVPINLFTNLQVNILDAIHWVKKSWDTIRSHTIQECFKKCGFVIDIGAPVELSVSDDDEEEIIHLLPNGITLKEYAAIGKNEVV